MHIILLSSSCHYYIYYIQYLFNTKVQLKTRCIVLAEGEVKQSLYVLLPVDIEYDILQRRCRSKYYNNDDTSYHILYKVYCLVKI